MAALTVSFTVLAVAWRSPRYDAATSGRPAPAWLSRIVDAPAFGVAARTFGFAVFAFSAMAAVLGQDRLTNPIFGIFYVWWWVGLVPLSLLLGPVYKAISPVRTINAVFARISGTDPDKGVFTYPERLGYWPAALGLLAFVWLELVYPYSTELGPVRLWCAAYVAAMLIGGALFGSGFYERGDPFEVYSTLVGKLSIWGRRDPEGANLLVVRSPLANLDTVVVRPGLVGGRGGAVRQHGLRLVQGLLDLDPVHPEQRDDLEQPRPRGPGQQPRAARVLRRGRADLRGRHDADRPSGRRSGGATCPTSSATRSCRSSSATSSPTT